MPFLCPRGICCHSTNRDVELLLKPVTFSGKASGSANQSWRNLLRGFLKVINDYRDCSVTWILSDCISPCYNFNSEDASKARNSFHHNINTSKFYKNISYTPYFQLSSGRWKFGKTRYLTIQCSFWISITKCDFHITSYLTELCVLVTL